MTQDRTQISQPLVKGRSHFIAFSMGEHGACSWETCSQAQKAPQVASWAGGMQGLGEPRHQCLGVDEHSAVAYSRGQMVTEHPL